MYLYPRYSYTVAVTVDLIIVVLCVLIISLIYNRYVEKPCLLMLKKIC